MTMWCQYWQQRDSSVSNGARALTLETTFWQWHWWLCCDVMPQWHKQIYRPWWPLTLKTVLTPLKLKSAELKSKVLLVVPCSYALWPILSIWVPYIYFLIYIESTQVPIGIFGVSSEILSLEYPRWPTPTVRSVTLEPRQYRRWYSSKKEYVWSTLRSFCSSTCVLTLWEPENVNSFVARSLAIILLSMIATAIKAEFYQGL